MTNVIRNIAFAGRPDARQLLPVLAMCFALGLQGQAPAPNESQPVTAVPRLVRIAETFHPANGLPVAPVESVTLFVYREEIGGAPLWQETQNVNVDSAGHYTALIGATRTEGVPVDLFNSSEPRWLGVQFNRTGETEQPRVRMASVPYALKASDAETLGGRPASDYLLAPSSNAATAASTAGAAGVASVAVAVTTAGSGVTVPDTSATGKLKPKATVGTTNCIGIFTDATDLGCSNMWQLSGNIGIGTHTPAAPLQVVSTLNPSALIDTYGNSANLRQRRADGTVIAPTGVRAGEVIGNTSFLGYGTTGFLPVSSAAMKALAAENYSDAAGGGILTYSTVTGGTVNLVERMRIDQNGNVGIGTTAPGFKLDVVGTINANNPVNSGNAAGVQGTSNSPNGAGVVGFNSVTSSGYPVGVQGNVSGTVGAGVSGNANMAGATGVNGFNSSTTGYAPGVAGGTASANGPAVSGFNSYTAGGMNSFPIGVAGSVNGPTGAGVSGYAIMAGAAGVSGNNNATSGYAVGVVGSTNSNGGAGVQGNAGTGAFAVSGFNGGTSGFGVGTQGNSSSPQGIGVLAVDWACGGSGCTLVPGVSAQFQTATTGTLLQGLSGAPGANTSTASQVFRIDGLGDANFSGWVQANSGSAGPAAVTGTNSATSGFSIGVQGSNNSSGGGGVLGVANQSGAFGVQGSSNSTSGTGVGVFAEAAGQNSTALLAQSQICGPSSCTLVNGTAATLETSTGGTLLVGTSGALGASNGSATQVFRVDGQGNLTAAGVPLNNVSGAAVLVDSSGHLGVMTSSRRFKKDIQDMGEATSGLMQLRPVTFRYKEPFADGSQPIQYGLIAEEVAEVYPDLVAHTSDGQIETVKYQVLDSMLLNEVQRLNKENHDLEQRLSRLEAAMEKLMAPATQP